MGKTLEVVGSKKGLIYVVLALCLILRLGYAWHHRAYTEVADAANYVSIAHNIADGKGYSWDHGTGDPSQVKPTAYGDPVWPSLLAVLFKIFGYNMLAIYIVQAFIDTLTCFLIFKLAGKFVASRGAPVLAALAYAVYPPFILCVGTVLTECLSFFLVVSAIYLLIRGFRGSVGQVAVAALVMGVLMLLKPAMLLMPFAVVVMAFLWRKQVPSWLGKAAVYVLISYVVVVPWTIRNMVVMHAFIPVATHGGVTMWTGTGPGDGITRSDWTVPLYTAKMPRPADPRAILLSQQAYDTITKLNARLKSADEVQSSKIYTQAAIDEIRSHPGKFAFLGAKKVFRLWFNLWNDEKPSKSSLALALFNVVMIGLAVLGSIRRGVDKMFVSATLWLAIYTTAVTICSMAVVRYSYPVYALIFILAAAGLVGARGKDLKKEVVEPIRAAEKIGA